MDESVALVIAPFRDIVDKGRTALENAGDNEPMRKAAQTLVREGERALTRIEPLCKKQFEEYSLNFINALKEDDTITKFRSELNDLLWEFDDYIEPDDFDQDKFDELRAASRKAAPQVIDIITRMKLEALPKPTTTPATLVTTISPPSSPQHPAATSVNLSPLLAIPPPLPPPTAPLPPLPKSSGSQSSRKSVLADGMAPLGLPVGFGRAQDAHVQPLKIGRSPSRGHEAAVGGNRADTPPNGHPMRPVAPLSPPPLPPSTNPWDHKVRPTIDVSQLPDRTNVSRRAPVPKPESPVYPSHRMSPDLEMRSTSTSPRPHAAAAAAAEGAVHESDDRRRLPSSTATYGIFPAPATTRPRAPTLPSSVSPMIPEDNVADSVPNGNQHPYSPSSYSAHSRHRDSSALSINSDLNLSSNQSQGARSSTATNYDSSRLSSTTKSSYRMSQTVAGLEVVVGSAITEDSCGPIPVDSERDSASSRTAADVASLSTAYPSSTRDCTIAGNSSFYVAGGFCEGAREIARGGAGIKKTKKPVGLSSSTSIARCMSCMFELDFRDVEIDVGREDKGNFLKCGIYFRIRFLQKCHIATKRNDDVLYGCPFCITNGRTIDDSDATVFFNVKALFTHLTWHARPLPEVPGFTIIESPQVPSEHHNDYDLHFVNPPVPHPVLDKAVDLSLSPVGIAREPVRKLVGQRLLPDRTPAHELALGAKVTGLTWPEKYHGEWCLGWHDGNHASVPTESLVLEPPPSHEVKMGGMSNIRAKVRWRFQPSSKDKGEWLTLSKGDTITNINWAYIDHWCWSGTNSKGKWGIFPQVFLDTNTMQEGAGTPTDRMSVISNEKKSGGIRSIFSSRSKPAVAKRPSIAGSTSSHETATASLASAFILPTLGN